MRWGARDEKNGDSGGHLGYQSGELRLEMQWVVVLGGEMEGERGKERETERERDTVVQYSPHLRSLCCAVHSGPPVQLFLYKKLQNSILQREKERACEQGIEGETERNRDTMGGVRREDKKH